jgi:hypothetical protein
MGMSALKPPASLQPEFDRYMRALRARAHLFDHYVATVRQGMSLVNLQSEATRLLHHEITLAAKLGLGQACNN